jgi:hypothetical protein
VCASICQTGSWHKAWTSTSANSQRINGRRVHDVPREVGLEFVLILIRIWDPIIEAPAFFAGLKFAPVLDVPIVLPVVLALVGLEFVPVLGVLGVVGKLGELGVNVG